MERSLGLDAHLGRKSCREIVGEEAAVRRPCAVERLDHLLAPAGDERTARLGHDQRVRHGCPLSVRARIDVLTFASEYAGLAPQVLRGRVYEERVDVRV